ncbi:MAG: hypothetical protein DWI57_00380 [Chloroflexi bacterium]|nr:MAG: hypothetical protein DWI57_00380 [Chloroflexota bacterium]
MSPDTDLLLTSALGFLGQLTEKAIRLPVGVDSVGANFRRQIEAPRTFVVMSQVYSTARIEFAKNLLYASDHPMSLS